MSDEMSQVTPQEMPQEMPQDTPQELNSTSPKAIGDVRTFKITVPLKSTFPLTTEDLFKIIEFLFYKFIQGTESSVDITINSDLFNVTVTATLST